VRRRHALVAGAALAWAAHRAAAQPTAGATIRVERGESLSLALDRARAGDTVELAAGDHFGQTGVVDQGALTLRAEPGGRAVLHAGGRHAEGKAIVVVRGGDVRVQGIEFRGARVPNGNGAGIRFERGRLQLAECGFFDNEMGLLSANDGSAELHVDRCEFGEAPRHQGFLHHLLYVGSIRRLELERSRLSGGWRGHLVKCRAREARVRCNRLDDGVGGEASYELEFPNGGLAEVTGNLVVQSMATQNSALLAYGAESPSHDACRLVVANNTFVNEADAPAWFVRTWPERLPPDAVVEVRDNLMIGAAFDGRVADGNRWLPLHGG